MARLAVTARVRNQLPGVALASKTKEEEIPGRFAPSVDGFRPDQTGSMTVSSVAHVQRITIGKVGGNISCIGHRNIWTFFSQLDVIPVVLESMRKQSRSPFLSARHYGK